MGRSEFAEPPVKIVLLSHVVQVQCSETPIGCLCGDGDHTRPSAFVVAGATSSSSSLTSPTTATESHFVLSGKVALAFEPKLKDPSIVKPQLELSFVGREHIDALSISSQQQSIHPESTKEFLRVTQLLPWIDRSQTPPTDPTIYEFSLLIPRALPPTATPAKGTIDYRIEAKFLLPHDEGFDELVAQKRVEVVRTHVRISGGSTVPPAPSIRPLTTSIQENEHKFGVTVSAPEYAYLDSASIPVVVELKELKGTLKSIRTVVIGVEEQRRYVSLRRNEEGKLVRGTAMDIEVLGEKVVTDVALIQTGRIEKSVKYGNGLAGAGNSGGIPMIVHPTFSGEKLFVSHYLTVKIVYGESAAVEGGGKLVGFFKKLTHNAAIPGNYEEEYSTKLILRTGLTQ
ncbi:hypothetical protein HDU79_007884 [Rhizoclosmatium sp. JEL0117]|nr:hypothetical protein HDU79_007884 [Rhizoclosmatium sp. JEL0117]